MAKDEPKPQPAKTPEKEKEKQKPIEKPSEAPPQTDVFTDTSERTWCQAVLETVVLVFSVVVIIVCPISIICCYNSCDQFRRLVVFRFGKVKKGSPFGPGVVWTIPCTDSKDSIDVRTTSIDVPSQEVLTKDSVTVTVSAVVYFHVANPVACILNVERHKTATELISVCVLRNILGQYTLAEMLTGREMISKSGKAAIDKVTVEWGVEMERVEIKDLVLPPDLQKAMAAEAEGTRLAKAKIIEAEGEIKAAENLKEASRIMMSNPQIMLLRYLQTLNYIAADQSTSIIFPFPIEMPLPQ